MITYLDIVQWTPEWLKIRKATITWSRIKALKTMPTDEKKVEKIDWNSNKTRPPAYVTFMNEMISEDLAPLPEAYQNEAMMRGNELEPEAREKYEAITGNKVEEIGFCVHSKRLYLGLSPDGLIKDKDKYPKAIEIKCPWPKNHIKIIKSNKIPEEYNDQILHNFLVNEDLKELDFITYNPDMYLEKLRIHIITVKREEYEKQIEETLMKLDIFADVWKKIIVNLTV